MILLLDALLIGRQLCAFHLARPSCIPDMQTKFLRGHGDRLLSLVSHAYLENSDKLFGQSSLSFRRYPAATLVGHGSLVKRANVRSM